MTKKSKKSSRSTKPRKENRSRSKKSKSRSDRSKKSPAKSRAKPHVKVSRKYKTSIRLMDHREKQIIKTAKPPSLFMPKRRIASKASPSMSIDELQYMAKSRGIPFGGLNKIQLIKKINKI